MSTELFDHNGLSLIRYTGPELPFSGDRTRYQITDEITGRVITINALQYAALTEFITADCSTECESPRTKPLPDNWQWETT